MFYDSRKQEKDLGDQTEETPVLAKGSERRATSDGVSQITVIQKAGERS